MSPERAAHLRGRTFFCVHLLCDSEGHPLSFHLTPGENHESTAFDVVLKNADENLFDVNGEPVPWPIAPAGDKGYRADWIDTCLPALEILPESVGREGRKPTELAVRRTMSTLRAHYRALSQWRNDWRR